MTLRRGPLPEILMQLKSDSACGPLMLIFDGNINNLSAESRAVLDELLKLTARHGGDVLEHYGSWDAVAQAFAADVRVGPPPLDA